MWICKTAAVLQRLVQTDRGLIVCPAQLMGCGSRRKRTSENDANISPEVSHLLEA